MITLQIINNLGVNVDIPDAGITIPPSGDTFTDPEFLRTICQSEDLRSRLTALDLTANDGVANLSVADAIVFLSLIWQQGGRSDCSGSRVVASGQTTVAGLATVTLATITRFAGERLAANIFVTDNVNGCNFAQGLSLLGTDSVRIYFEKTNVANQVLVKASNAHLTQSRTIDWAVTGVRV